MRTPASVRLSIFGTTSLCCERHAEEKYKLCGVLRMNAISVPAEPGDECEMCLGIPDQVSNGFKEVAN
jgi:hypothetical protein